MKIAVLCLLFKKGNPQQLKNWRPISLLNIDYKVNSKCITVRLKKYMKDIIHPNQTCSIKGRNIKDNLLLLRDIIYYTVKEHKNLIAILIDQEKAFDRVDFDFIFAALETLKVPPILIKWCRILYKNISSTVKVNGYLTNTIPVKKGVRQGDSISPLLFIIVAEALAIEIRKDPRIHGFEMPISRAEVKESSYADDKIIYCKDQQSSKNALNKVESFCKASGMKINKEKSEILLIGKNNNRIAEIEGIPVKQKVKYLGVWFTKNGRGMNFLNYEEELKKIRDTLKFWRSRYMSIYGKAFVVNAFAFSRIWYRAAVLSMDGE